MKRYCSGLMALIAITALTGCADDTANLDLQTPEGRGHALARERGCTACHALDGTRGIGPGWGGIYGAIRNLKDGGGVVVDEDYLRRAILDPSAEVVDGFDSIMIPAAVNEAQLADIIALIKSLGNPATP
jgi:cytochrome c oxidase subunit 2